MAYIEGEVPTIVSGGNNGGGNAWGNSDAWVLIILFALIFGNGFGGWGGGNNGTTATLSGIATRNDLCEEFNFNNLENRVGAISDAVNTGFANLNSTICNQEYETAGLINNLGVNMLQGFNSMNIANLQSSNAIQSQLAQCCCNLERGQERIACQMATDTGAIISAGNQNTQRILDYLCNEKIEALRAENTQLSNTISQQAQSQYIINQIRPFPTASYVVPNPFTGSYGFNSYGNGYGCGYGCGCGC